MPGGCVSAETVVRYIHLNPVRAGIVTEFSQLNQYRYCGHGSIMGKQDMPWQDGKYVLGYFGKTIKGARRSYSSYVEAGFNQGRRDELTGGGLIRSLGGWSEIEKAGIKRPLHHTGSILKICRQKANSRNGCRPEAFFVTGQ